MEFHKIVIGNSRFRHLAGSEITTIELAEEFHSRGAEVAIASFEFGGQITELAQAAGFRLIDLSCENLSGEIFDLAWIHHPPTYYSLLINSKANVRTIVYSSLSHFEPLEAPPVVISHIDKFLVHSNENLEFFLYNYPDLSAGLEIFPNSSPREFWRRKTKNTDHELRSIAVVSNHPPEELLQAVHLLRDKSVRVDIYGNTGTPARITPDLLDQYSATITIGKTVQYCLARRRPVFCYDHFGGPGWILPGNFIEASAKNFSGRCTPERVLPGDLAASIINGYMRSLECADQLYALAYDRFCLQRNLDNLLKKIEIDNEGVKRITTSATAANVLSRQNANFIRQQKTRFALEEAYQINSLELKSIKESQSWALTTPLRKVHQILCGIFSFFRSL